MTVNQCNTYHTVADFIVGENLTNITNTIYSLSTNDNEFDMFAVIIGNTYFYVDLGEWCCRFVPNCPDSLSGHDIAIHLCAVGQLTIKITTVSYPM